MTVQDGAVLRCSARWTSANGQDNVNVWWMRTDFTAPQTDEDTFDGVDAMITEVFQDFDHLIRNTWSVRDLKVDVVEHIGGKWTTTQNVGFGSWGAGISCLESSDALPEGVSPVGFLYTGLGKHQGRKFFFGATESYCDAGGNMVGTLVTAIVTGLTQLLTPHVISAGNNLVAVVADMAMGITRDIVEVAATGVFGYQRRRKPGVGS